MWKEFLIYRTRERASRPQKKRQTESVSLEIKQYEMNDNKLSVFLLLLGRAGRVGGGTWNRAKKKLRNQA